MKNICTPETARALKDAGFPQPEPELGQVWYDTDGEAFVCLDSTGYFVSSAGGGVFQPENMERLAFAPTAVDILRELPEMRLYFYAGRWHLEDVEDEFVLRQFSGEIAAEACAAAWLAQNRK